MKDIVPKKCPICGIETNYTYDIEESDKEKARWYRCTCGVIFQEEFKPDIVSEDLGDSKRNQRHAVRVYAPIIEELTYGRMMLHPGHESAPEVRKEMQSRGWLNWGIEGNICEHDFKIKLDKNIGTGEIKKEYDLIWLQHYLEHQRDPIAILKKSYELLSDTGIIFITTPDIEFIHKQGMQYWPYWRRKENNILWSERALRREVERIGYKVVMSRRNYAARFMGHFDIHLIAQKNYF